MTEQKNIERWFNDISKIYKEIRGKEIHEGRWVLSMRAATKLGAACVVGVIGIAALAYLAYKGIPSPGLYISITAVAITTQIAIMVTNRANTPPQ